MLKQINGVRLVRFEPEYHAAKLYEWHYSEDYQEFFRDFPDCPSATELAKLAQGRAFIILKECEVEGVKQWGIAGLIVYSMANEVSKNFEVSLLIDVNFQKQGCFVDAFKIFLNWIFNSKNFYKAKVKILAENRRVCEIVERFGAFREGGQHAFLKKDIFFKSKFHDVAAYAIFKTDFNKLYLKEFEPRLEPLLEKTKRSA